jgi:hypothetical protein
MTSEIRQYTEKDYDLLKSWWNAHNWKEVPSSSLPACGYIVNNVCAGFLYLTNSDMALLEWVVSDPNSKADLRDQSLDLLLAVLTEEAKLNGVKFIFTATRHPKLQERYKNHKFLEADREMVHFIRKV